MLVTTESLSLSAQIATTAVGALLAVLATTWLRTHTLARLELVLKSRDRCEWIYAMVFWVLAVLLAITYRVLGLIPGRYAVGLTAGSTFVVLGVSLASVYEGGTPFASPALGSAGHCCHSWRYPSGAYYGSSWLELSGGCLTSA